MYVSNVHVLSGSEEDADRKILTLVANRLADLYDIILRFLDFIRSNLDRDDEIEPDGFYDWNPGAGERRQSYQYLFTIKYRTLQYIVLWLCARHLRSVVFTSD